VPVQTNKDVMKNRIIFTTSLLCLSLAACSKQAQMKTNFFIQQNSISEFTIPELLEDLDSLPKQINGCDVSHHKATDELFVQCSKKGFNYTNKQVSSALSGALGFSSTEQFGQYNFRWKTGAASCSIAIEEDNDIFELWCGKGT
jgi:outer membrane biogenesis lipoprotein LolB